MEDLQTRFYCFVFYSSENVSDGYQTMTANDPLFLPFEMFHLVNSNQEIYPVGNNN